MATPHEIAARYVAPYLKALVARSLYREGMGQERIARLLGVTQPMVSKYLRWSRGYIVERLAAAGVDAEEAEAVAEAAAAALLRGDVQRYIAVLASYMNSLLARGSLCALHRRLAWGLDGCGLCSSLFQSPADPLVEEVREAARLLAEAPGAYALIPRVGSNIVAARPGARTVSEVVGFTGGIFRAGARVAVVGDPVYGGSRHTARVLLAAHRRWPRLRAAVVAAYSAECASSLGAMGRVVEAGPHRSPSRLEEELEEALEEAPGEPVALVSLGGVNLEPVIYVFGAGAVEAVRSLLAACLPGPGGGGYSLGLGSSV